MSHYRLLVDARREAQGSLYDVTQAILRELNNKPYFQSMLVLEKQGRCWKYASKFDGVIDQIRADAKGRQTEKYLKDLCSQFGKSC